MVHGVAKSWTERLTPHHHHANLVSYLWTKPKAFDSVICLSLSQKLTELRGARLYGPTVSEADRTERSVSEFPPLCPEADWTGRSMSAWAHWLGRWLTCGELFCITPTEFRSWLNWEEHVCLAPTLSRSWSNWEDRVCMDPLSQKVTELRAVCLPGTHNIQKLIELRGADWPHWLHKLTELGGACLHGPTVSEGDWTEGIMLVLPSQSPEADSTDRNMSASLHCIQKLTKLKGACLRCSTFSEADWSERSMSARPPLSEADWSERSMSSSTLLSQNLSELRGACLHGSYYIQKLTELRNNVCMAPLSPEADWTERSISTWHRL